MSLTGHSIARIHTPLHEGNSRGQEVIDLAEKIGIPLLPWQAWVVKDMFAVDADGKFVRRSLGLLIARQNGKTHLARMIILWQLLQGKRIIGMSSKRAMAEETWRTVVDIIMSHDWLVEELKVKPRFANGQERIEFKNGGKYEVVDRKSTRLNSSH